MMLYNMYNTWVMEHEVQIAELRANLRDILDQVRSGETITVLHYGKPIARITPYEEPAMSEPITAATVTHEVTESLTGDAADFDVEGIVRDIIDTYGRVNIDTIPEDDYWAIVQKHDTSA